MTKPGGPEKKLIADSRSFFLRLFDAGWVTGRIRSAKKQWRSKALRGPGSTVTWGPSLSLPSTSPSLPFPFSSSSPTTLPLPRSRPQIQLGGKLLQRGLGRSPSRNRIWCSLALKSVIWWKHFIDFSKSLA